MKYSRVFIDAIGYELPPVVVTSQELETRLQPLYQALRIPEVKGVENLLHLRKTPAPTRADTPRSQRRSGTPRARSAFYDLVW